MKKTLIFSLLAASFVLSQSNTARAVSQAERQLEDRRRACLGSEEGAVCQYSNYKTGGTVPGVCVPDIGQYQGRICTVQR